MVIDKGIEAGETVVTEGQLRLAPGSRVVVRDGTKSGGGRGRGQSPSQDGGRKGNRPGGTPQEPVSK
jgi:hypothetical protein